MTKWALAVPSSDVAPGLIAPGAAIRPASVKGGGTVPVEKFVNGLSCSVMKTNELALDVQVPPPLLHAGMIYLKDPLGGDRKAAVAGLAVRGTLAAELCGEVRVGLGSVAPTSLGAPPAEEVFQGGSFGDDPVEETTEEEARAGAPTPDIRAPAGYRREIVKENPS